MEGTLVRLTFGWTISNALITLAYCESRCRWRCKENGSQKRNRKFT